MGQELLEARGVPRNRTRYFLATTSTGLRVIRGSTNREYPYACVATTRTNYGSTVDVWSSREELAQKNLKSMTKWYNKSTDSQMSFEVIRTQEISAKEARVIKKELHKEFMDYREEKK